MALTLREKEAVSSGTIPNVNYEPGGVVDSYGHGGARIYQAATYLARAVGLGQFEVGRSVDYNC